MVCRRLHSPLKQLHSQHLSINAKVERHTVVSLIVALYAIKLAGNASSAAYSYGWQRAEVLGALINGVFLIALCFSICLEAVQRLFSKPGMFLLLARLHTYVHVIFAV